VTEVTFIKVTLWFAMLYGRVEPGQDRSLNLGKLLQRSVHPGRYQTPASRKPPVSRKNLAPTIQLQWERRLSISLSPWSYFLHSMGQ
jgi:hypothetical protein